MTDMSADLPTFPSPPASRAYVHRACGSVTVVDGEDFQGLCHPYLGLVPTTRCVHCNKQGPLRDFTWADTGESISDYRKRLRAAAPAHWRVIHPLTKLLVLVLPVLGFLAGRAIATERTVLLPAIGVVVGLVVGAMAFGIGVAMHDRDYRVYR